jgi:hypothetical protein
MEIQKKDSWLMAANSPIEFVLIGTKGRRNAILVRSDDVSPDLLGFVVTSDDAGQEQSHFSIDIEIGFFKTRVMLRNAGSLFGGVFASRRTLNLIQSRAIQQLGDDVDRDDRPSAYRFAWVGECSTEQSKKVRAVFNEHVVDLQRSIFDNDVEQVEWNLAPTLYECMKINASYRPRDLFYRAYFLSIAVLAAAALLITLITVLVKQILRST